MGQAYVKTTFVLNLWLILLALSNGFVANYWPEVKMVTSIIYIVLLSLFVFMNALLVQRHFLGSTRHKLSSILRRMNH